MHLLATRLFLLILLPLMLAGPAAAEDETDDSLLTLKKIFESTEYDAKHFGPARWLDDGSGYTMLEDSSQSTGGKDLVSYDPKTGRRTVLVPARRLIPSGTNKPLAIAGHSWSADRKKLLIFTNTRRVWRRHTRGDYWVLDLAGGDLRQLGGDAEEATLMFAKFSPDGNRVGYVCKNNIYVQDLTDLRITPLTKDGSKTIINGTSDWVYEPDSR